jgi:hypothetical protein
LFTFDGMKRLFFLLLVYGLSIFLAPAQTHFITAGQTQGMIFTDYVPDNFLFHAGNNLNVGVDINHDGNNDLEFESFSSGSGPSSHTAYSTSFNSTDSSVQIRCTQYSSNGCWGVLYMPQVFYFGDTILNDSPSIYSSNSRINYSAGVGCSFGLSSVAITDCFFSGRIVASSDTSLFYVHFSRNSSSDYYCLDYGVEGTDSSSIIASTNNLSPTNISISPNPFTNQINIGINKAVEYQLTDYTGRVLLSGKTEKSISTEILPPGSYLLFLKNDELYLVKKMVK